MHAHFEKPYIKLKNVNSTIQLWFNTENTKIKIEKSATNFYVWISVLYQFFNFDFRLSNLIFIF